MLGVRWGRVSDRLPEVGDRKRLNTRGPRKSARESALTQVQSHKPILSISPAVTQLRAPAKVNLFLKVLRKRPDGFHDLDSLFQAVSLYDDVQVSVHPRPTQPNATPKDTIRTVDAKTQKLMTNIPDDERNFALKAVAAVRNAATVIAQRARDAPDHTPAAAASPARAALALEHFFRNARFHVDIVKRIPLQVCATKVATVAFGKKLGTLFPGAVACDALAAQ